MNILEAIERERWDVKNNPPVAKQEDGIETLKVKLYLTRENHNISLDRIAEAAKQPRVMKRWAEDCKPEPYTWNWVDLGGTGFGVEFLTPKEIKLGRSGPAIILHWLELEPTPVLPAGGE